MDISISFSDSYFNPYHFSTFNPSIQRQPFLDPAQVFVSSWSNGFQRSITWKIISCCYFKNLLPFTLHPEKKHMNTIYSCVSSQLLPLWLQLGGGGGKRLLLLVVIGPKTIYGASCQPFWTRNEHATKFDLEEWAKIQICTYMYC